MSLYKETLYAPIDWTRNAYANDVSILQIRFCSLHKGNNGIVFKNLYFETRFQNFEFSGPQKAAVV